MCEHSGELDLRRPPRSFALECTDLQRNANHFHRNTALGFHPSYAYAASAPYQNPFSIQAVRRPESKTMKCGFLTWSQKCVVSTRAAPPRSFCLPYRKQQPACCEGGRTTSHAHPERRRLARLPLRVVVRLRIPGADTVAFAETRDVSARGIYLYTDCPLQLGQEVECVLVLPEALTQASAPTLVACSGKILRIEPSPIREKTGIAVEISSFDFSSGHNSSVMSNSSR